MHGGKNKTIENFGRVVDFRIKGSPFHSLFSDKLCTIDIRCDTRFETQILDELVHSVCSTSYRA